MVRSGNLISRNKLVTVFLASHLLFAAFLGRLFALAPDEGGYLYTFDNFYGSKDPNPQYNSGWITAPKPFLWILYLPAKGLNLIGIPDYLSIRILSIAAAALSLVLLINLKRRSGKPSGRFEKAIFLVFFIPSVFLWTSVGLRETFIILSCTLVLVGFDYLLRGSNVRGVAYLCVGSYMLMSTKNYLWICLVLSAIVVAVVMLLKHASKRAVLNFGVGLVLIPSILFASTTSVYALQFLMTSIFHTNVSDVGSRSGDSIVQLAIPNPDGTLSNNPGNGNSPGKKGGKKTTLVTFHGDSTLIFLHFYLVEHPKALFARTLRAVGLEAKIQRIWDAKVKAGLIKKTVSAMPDSSSLNGYILKPGKIHHPLSIARPAFLFMFGPIPFLDQGGFALNTATAESPIWWVFYGLVLYRLIRYRRSGYTRDPLFLLAAVYFVSLVAFSALVEVNLGTSFRHRSILLVPLLVMYIRARGRDRAIAY